MTKYNTTTLENGLRVIHLPSNSPVVYCGIGVNAGSRQEAEGEEGVAHFCEHVTFKGTRKRSALQILNCLEQVGGDLNAFTNKEDTIFYAAILKEHLPRAVDLLTDIVFQSVYPEEEIRHETDVICDEIESYNDTPAELIYDEFENMIFRGHPLGHNILGTRERVQGFTADHARRFTSRYYRPDNAVFFIYGDVDFDRLTTKILKPTPCLKPTPYPSRTGGESKMTSSEKDTVTDTIADTVTDTIADTIADTAAGVTELPSRSGGAGGGFHGSHHQAHVMLGSRTFDYNDERRMPLYLLNNILGGPGMNARLNLSLRERHGLVYTVESSMGSYSDTGCWSVYFGCDHHDVKRCLKLVNRELDRMMQHPLSDRQLAAAKRQLKGQIAIACDNREQYALDFAKNFLHYGRERSIDDLLQHIDAITASQMQDVAQEVFHPDRLSTLIL